MPTVGTIAIVLFFTLNSIGNLPIFIALLNRYSTREQIAIIIREMLIALGLILLFAYAGQQLLKLLGLSEYAISVGGGIILLLISIRLVFPHHHFNAISHEQGDAKPLIVPLATPIMAGGGTLATVMMYGLQTDQNWALFFGIFTAWLASTLVVLFSPTVVKLLKRELLVAIERLSGLILILIAAQMLLSGITDFATTEVHQLLPNTKASENSP